MITGVLIAVALVAVALGVVGVLRISRGDVRRPRAGERAAAPAPRAVVAPSTAFLAGHVDPTPFSDVGRGVAPEIEGWEALEPLTMAAPPSRTSAHEWVGQPEPERRARRLAFADGTVLTLDSAIVFGRNPEPPVTCADAIPMPLEDPAMALSKTHLLVLPGRDGAVVTDLHSTNGVRVSTGSDGPERIPPGVPTHAAVGATVLFGSLRMVVTE